ncbi:hypothetical protein NW768_004714 [Fusarium equiseti]|uniref:Tetratricopeptide repeat domain-containing protein n=1 Tax=Fusarium equiseti TaxID=61235 RepID=A0ABQ8RH17_FUSEQ|nr:hypothetical protein NW768_004714 [Fusarium equiseti]
MKVESSVIAVPGYCTPGAPEWGMKQELQKAAISLDSVSNLHMYIYSPDYVPPDEFSWESFLKAGSDLAEDLAKLSDEFPHRPIIFIAHSLGGVLLKKALLLAHQNVHDPRFKLVIHCLSGILFLGTPHTSASDKDTLLCHNQVLHSCAKISVQKRASKLSSQDATKLATLAAHFEEIANVPILSVFECEESHKIQKFFGTRKRVLVDQQLATISANAERLLGIHLSHLELCKLEYIKDLSTGHSARKFLRDLLEDLATRKLQGRKASDDESFRSVPRPLNPLNLPNIPPMTTIPRADSFDSAHQSSTRLALRPFPNQQLPKPGKRSLQRFLSDKKPKLPCFTLTQPSINPDFTGRTDCIRKMDEFLLPGASELEHISHGPRIFALCGMGGIGKTDLAVQYAHLRRDRFDAVFWLEAGGVSQLASNFGQIPTELQLESAEEAQDLELSIEIAKEWLATTKVCNNQASDSSSRRPWLLIFDNADNLDIIVDYIPFAGSGSILMTSRDPAAKTDTFENSFGFDMDPLSPIEAADLLRRLTRRQGDSLNQDEQEASLTIAKNVDGLPLAMTQMAGFIRKRQLSMREFVELYNTDARYMQLRDDSTPSQQHRYGLTLATTWSFQGLSSTARRLLEILSFLNPDRIQEDIFQNPDKQNDVAWFWDADTFVNARSELLNSSIIKRDISNKELWIHRLIQTEVRTGMNEQGRYDTFTEAVRLLNDRWMPGDLCSQASQRWSLCERLLPHLERAYSFWMEYSKAWRPYPVDEVLPSLMNEAAVYLHERGFSQEGKLYLKLGLELCERGGITHEPLISDMHLTMGALCNETNDAKGCLEHNILCLAKRKEHAEQIGKPDLRLAFAHSQMGIAYMMIKKFAKATEYFKQCDLMLKGLPDLDVDEFGFPVCNLGLAYWVQGELEEADKTLTDLLAQREQRHGKLDRVSYKTGRVLQALGNVRSSKAAEAAKRGDDQTAQRLYDESFVIHTNCLAQYESTLGKFNHRTADACHKLAEHHIRRGEDDVAQDYLDRALGIWGERSWFKNESARTSFLRGKHLQNMGGKENVENGSRWIQRAILLRREVGVNDDDRELDTHDFDDLVCFWSI